MQEDVHVFQGIKRDAHPIRQDKQFLWDAHNIRLTTRDGDTMMSITNEKSTNELMRFATGETYIGHAILGKYLILFTKTGSTDTIYRIEMGTLKKVVLFKGDLNFSTEYPIQAIADYESELVQKVYWVDGKNNPRVINIVKPELLKVAEASDYTSVYTDSPFGFVQNLTLNEDVAVERMPNGSGIFSPGVIQYAFTYYHKYGQESNIFHVTEPLYVSYNDRGGSPEDNISTAFQLHVDGIQSNFQYLRIYSILRTSIDAIPTVKRITDIELSGATEITYVDNGTTGDIVDPSMLLYIGGKDIVAGCISSKDNTLFLGDITYERKEVQSIEGLPQAVKSLGITTGTRTEELSDYGSSNSIYKYHNQLTKNTSTFKVGETYRLGLQFQYKNGEWSEPLFIKDTEMTGQRPAITDQSVILPVFKASIASLKTIAGNNGYLKVRPLIVMPSTKDKTILAQGILCPTVFNAGNRESNTPFAQSSWFLRPFCSQDPTTANGGAATEGAIAEFRHYNPLITGFDRGSEIQNMFLDTDATSNTANTLDTSLKKAKEALTGSDRDSSYEAMYYVDQSILTFHSPDIEFDDATMLAINGNTGLEVKLVGVVPFNSNCGDINIQESSVVVDPDASGFIHRSIINPSHGGRSLISGLFYEDAYVDEGKNADKFYRQDVIRPWMTYLWHRSGSLNNDCVRPEGKGSRTAILKKKIISNIKFSKDVSWLSGDPINIPSSEIQVFNSNEVSLLKIKDPNNKTGDITYYGNVDSMNASYSKFRLVVGSAETYELSNGVTKFSGYIIVSDGDKISELYFSNLSVNPQSGNKVTGTMSGTVTSHTTVRVPVQTEDNITGEVKIEYKNVDLYGASFDITIDSGSSSSRAYTGSITINGDAYSIRGNTTFDISYKKKARAQTAFNFGAGLVSIDPSNGYIGDYQEALKLPKDAVRIKYKSTPHLLLATQYENGARKPLPVISGTSKKNVSGADIYWQSNEATSIPTYSDIAVSRFTSLTGVPAAYLWLAEIRQNNVTNRFGGDTQEALMNNLWIPAGPAIRLDSDEELTWKWGDTWFQRYDCLKTYPFTTEDENQVVEIGSFMCETRVNIDGRYDRNRGAVSNLNMSPLNFNLMNPVYSQKNTFFNYRMLDADYYKVNSYPSQLMWTGVKSPAAIQDAWTNLHTASSLDLDGANGRLVSVQPFNDLLIGFQESGVQQILFNSRVQIQASDGVPIEIANSQKVEGTRAFSNIIGCQDKFGIITTPAGVYFIDNEKHHLYVFNEGIRDLGLSLGSLYWPRENYSNMTWRFKPSKSGNNGVRLYYDSKFQDVYFTPGADYGKTDIREALCFSEQLNQFTSLMSYGGAVMFSLDSKFYSIANNEDGIMALYENFSGDTYNTIFGKPRPFSFSFISNDNPTITKIFDTVELRSDCYNKSDLLGDEYSTKVQTGQPFDYIRVDNEYQDTKDVAFNAANLRKKFRIWRALIPRNYGTRERIRNPWAKITLGCKSPGTNFTILHDLSVKYTI